VRRIQQLADDSCKEKLCQSRWLPSSDHLGLEHAVGDWQFITGTWIQKWIISIIMLQ